jgi:hypothetical protein
MHQPETILDSIAVSAAPPEGRPEKGLVCLIAEPLRPAL